MWRMKIQLNGEAYELPEGVETVSHLLDHLQVGERIVVVERNREIVDRKKFSSTQLEEGDILEIVHFVGGGAPC